MRVNKMLSGLRTLAKERNKVLVDAVFERIMPVWGDIEKEAEQFQSELWHSIMNQPSSGEDEPGDYVDHVVDQAVDYYEDLSFMKVATLNTMTTCLYHLWEKDLKSYLFRTVVRYGGENQESVTGFGVNFQKLVRLMKKYGFDLEKESYYQLMDQLRQTANASKHSDTPPKQLLLERPDLFEEDGIVVNSLKVTPKAFKKFANAIEQFWLNLELTY